MWLYPPLVILAGYWKWIDLVEGDILFTLIEMDMVAPFVNLTVTAL